MQLLVNAVKVLGERTHGHGAARLLRGIHGEPEVLGHEVYQEPALNALCGFKEQEIVDLLERIREAAETEGRRPRWDVGEARETIRDWYNGYRFSLGSAEQVYNPTMALYFLNHLQRHQQSPRQLLDNNLQADEDKLRFVGQIVSGQQTLLDVVQKDAPIRVGNLAGRFTELLSSEGTLSAMGEKGLRRAAEFTWEKTAAMTLDVYRAAAGEGRGR